MYTLPTDIAQYRRAFNPGPLHDCYRSKRAHLHGRKAVQMLRGMSRFTWVDVVHMFRWTDVVLLLRLAKTPKSHKSEARGQIRTNLALKTSTATPCVSPNKGMRSCNNWFVASTTKQLAVWKMKTSELNEVEVRVIWLSVGHCIIKWWKFASKTGRMKLLRRLSQICLTLNWKLAEGSSKRRELVKSVGNTTHHLRWLVSHMTPVGPREWLYSTAGALCCKVQIHIWNCVSMVTWLQHEGYYFSFSVCKRLKRWTVREDRCHPLWNCKRVATCLVTWRRWWSRCRSPKEHFRWGIARPVPPPCHLQEQCQGDRSTSKNLLFL